MPNWLPYVLSFIFLLAIIAIIYIRIKYRSKQIEKNPEQEVVKFYNKYESFQSEKRFKKVSKIKIANNENENVYLKTKLSIYKVPEFLQNVDEISKYKTINWYVESDKSNQLVLDGMHKGIRTTALITDKHIYFVEKTKQAIELAKIKNYYLLFHKYNWSIVITTFHNEKFLFEVDDIRFTYYFIYLLNNLKLQ